MTLILRISIGFAVFLVPAVALGQANATGNAKIAPTGTQGAAAVPTEVTVRLVQPPSQPKPAVELWAPYLVAIAGLLAAVFTAVVALRQARQAARYNYAGRIMRFRLRQIEEFYAPAFLLIEQSRVVYEKLLWTLKKVRPDFRLDGFRLLDHIHQFKGDRELMPLITRILNIGDTLTVLITKNPGLIEGGVTPTFIEYVAHFQILKAASEQELSEHEKEGWHEFGYYPRMLNREIREGFKVVLVHLANYVKAGDDVIAALLRQKPTRTAEYRRELLENLAYYERHASDYAGRFDNFDLSVARKAFMDTVEAALSRRPIGVKNDIVKILDAGCGTGRDTYAFLKKGYVVTAIEASPKMLRECRRKVRRAARDADNEEMRHAAEASEEKCLEMNFDELKFQNEFDGVWAAASLLHVPVSQIEGIVRKLIQALRPGGTLFMSFKYGHGQRAQDMRFYSYYGRNDIRALLGRIDGAEDIRIWLSDTTGAVLPRRRQLWAWALEWVGCYDRTLWLNVMLRKRPG